jgi:hypothetical protein
VNTVEVTLGELIDRTLLQIQSAPEQGGAVTIASDLPLSDNQFTLSSSVDGMNVSDVVEFGTELMLVTGKSADADPEYTVSRGYYQTEAMIHTAGDVGQVNPTWPRRRIAEGVRRCFTRLEALGLPLFRSGLFFPVESVADTSQLVLELPEATRDVLSVRYGLSELARWHFVDDLPTSEYSSGKVVRLPRSTSTTAEFSVTYRIPYRWSTHPVVPGESATIDLPEGAEDLPCAYAVAWLVSAREVSRSDIDRAEEWSRSEPMRNGASQGVVRGLWQEFYRGLDEARRLDPPLPRRPFIRRSR